MKAFEVIATPEQWCTDFLGDDGSREFDHLDPACPRRCAQGAIEYAYNYAPCEQLEEVLTRLREWIKDHTAWEWIGDWNDAMDWVTVHRTLKELGI